MNKIWKYTLLVLVLFVFSGMQSTVHAECGGATPNFFCDDLPPNPSLIGVKEGGNHADLTVGVLPGAGIDTNTNLGGSCIAVGNGNNEITINGGNLICHIFAIVTGFGNNEILIVDSNVVTPDATTILTGGGDTTIDIRNSTITSTNPSFPAIFLSGAINTVRLGTGAEVNGIIRGGFPSPNNFDTLVFEMEVLAGEISSLCSELEGLDPADDSITINGLFYEWVDFNELDCDLQPIVVTRDVPTLSEWGLIAMAAILGMVGFMVIRRRQAIA